MKRLNPNTNQPFKRGDVRSDGYIFDKYNLSAKIKKDGFFQENWLSPKVFNKESEAALLRSAKHHILNKQKRNKQSAEWRKNNLEKSKMLVRNWFAKNKDKRASYEAKRRATLLQRTPKWLTDIDLWVIEEAYHLAQLRTNLFKFEWHVDHIIPLQGKNVSGLHVPSNLRVIPGSENTKKQNKYTI